MPETVSERLARSGLGIDKFQYDSGFTDRDERIHYPVILIHLLPSNHVKFAIVLVGEYKSHEIVVIVVIDEKGAFVIDTAEYVRSLTDKDSASFLFSAGQHTSLPIAIPGSLLTSC